LFHQASWVMFSFFVPRSENGDPHGGNYQTLDLHEVYEDVNIPIESFPPLPPRGLNFYIGPWISLVLVFAFIVQAVALPTLASRSYISPLLTYVILPVVWLSAFAAVLVLASLVLGRTGELRRSDAVCYPIPGRAKALLLFGQGKHEECTNIAGIAGTSYCTRCFIWRPADNSHHCSTCQRCVTGFDHHCSFFGRCITQHNMNSFRAIIALFFVGVGVQILTLMIAATAPKVEPAPLIIANPVAVPVGQPAQGYYER